MPGSRSLPALLRCLLVAACAGILPAVALSQTRWVVDPKSSLVWWQMSPHLNHLWGTTCPEERSWRPGENRSPGWRINPRLRLPGQGEASNDDTVNVPLFPRDEVEAVCSPAVKGEVFLPDTVTWRGAHGTVSVLTEGLVSGQAMRDILTHQVLQAKSFPDITFKLDSLVSMKREKDALVGTLVGTLSLHGVDEPITATVRMFPDGGGMRVLAKWRMTIEELTHNVIPKIRMYSLGANTNIWHDFFMGADLVFIHAEQAGAN